MRLAIYIKDVELITGRTNRSAKYYLSKVRRHYNKERHQIVTVEEFCAYSGLPIQEVIDYLKL